jgi:hypothetical protein
LFPAFFSTFSFVFFANIMNGLKDGVDDAVNAVTNSANAAIGSLPSL